MRIVSYNILAPSYVKPEWYPFTDRRLLAWEARRDRLIARLLELNGDALCLQEVEPAVLAWMRVRLEPAGYASLYTQKGQGRPDGCATFYRSTRLSLVESSSLYYRDGGGGRDSGHVALMATFLFAGIPVNIANTHLRWDAPEKRGDEHVGYRQVRELLTHVTSVAHGPARVLCGDFNAEPESPVVQAVLASGLRDAYADMPQPTANTSRQAKRIDYLFYPRSLEPAPMALPPVEDETPLPSGMEPSDHLPIAADLNSATRGDVIPLL